MGSHSKLCHKGRNWAAFCSVVSGQDHDRNEQGFLEHPEGTWPLCNVLWVRETQFADLQQVQKESGIVA